MTDQGRGYGAAPWGNAEPNQGTPYPGTAGYPQPSAWGDPQAPQPQPQPQPYPEQPQQPQQPYGGHPQDPYGTGQYPTHPGYQGQQAPGYAPQPAPAQPQQPRQPHPAPEPAPVLGPDGIDWEAEAAALDAQGHGSVYAPADYAPAEEESLHVPAEEQHDVPAGYQEAGYQDEEDYQPFLAADDDSRSGERRRKQLGRTDRKRSGVACLGISMLLVAAVAGGGYYGYGFYEKHWGPPADYAGSGSGSVSITIPKGALGWDMANVLKAAGVVESGQAFVDAYGKNPKASGIQPGSYTLHERMSAASALAMLLDANGGNVLTIPEGLPAGKIYPLIDTKLGVPAGTTANAAKADVAKLGLPAFAHGNIEGFLWPARYSVAKGMKPDDLLKQMVTNAVAKFQSLGMDSGAAAVKLKSGYEVLIEASILQAEGNNSKDFGKIARVLSNRLNGPTGTYGLLGLDTTLQYALKSTHFTYAQKEHDKAGGYNTYIVAGLPPGPISNPGDEAIQAVLNPTPGPWAYFIAMDPSNTQFAVTFDEFKVYVKQYCTAHKLGFDAAAGACT